MPNDLDDGTDDIDNEITVDPTAVDGASVGLITPADAQQGGDHQVALDVGDTLITVRVVAADGTTQQVYTVTVTRAASSDATLSGLSLGDDVDLAPTFEADTTEYTADADNDEGRVTVTATATAGDLAKVAISPDDAVEDVENDADTTGHQVDLDVGETTITVTVTAEDESTQSYTVTVTRAELGISSDSTLS